MTIFKKIALTATVAATAFATPAFADETTPTTVAATAAAEAPAPVAGPAKVARIGLGVTGGSLGIGPEISYALNRNFDIRGNATFFSISHGFSGAMGYKGSAVLGSGGLMIDYHIAGGGFRISAGARINHNKARVAGTPANGATLNGTSYSAAQIGTLRANADFATIAPTVTFGYAGNLGHGFKLGIEAGAMFSGSAHLKPFTATGVGVADADLQAERQRIQDKINPYKVYPILQISVGYRF